jgi:dipeptidyl aminopeptidase/acylaminoacyl peptidase
VGTAVQVSPSLGRPVRRQDQDAHLLITGEGDWNVPAGNTRELYYALRRLGKECVWVNYWNDGHGIGAAENEATYLDKWERVVDWYRTHFEKTEGK